MAETKTMENQTEETNNTKNEAEETQSTNSGTLKRSIAGGMIGAAVGYLATPENGKKIRETISMDKLKSSGSGIGQAVMEKSKNAVGNIKNSASKLFGKQDGDSIEETTGNEMSAGAENKSSNNSEQKSNQERSSLDGRLDRLEEMLMKLMDGNGQSQNQMKEEKNSESGKGSSLSHEMSTKQEDIQQDQVGSSKGQSETKGQKDSEESGQLTS